MPSAIAESVRRTARVSVGACLVIVLAGCSTDASSAIGDGSTTETGATTSVATTTSAPSTTTPTTLAPTTSTTTSTTTTSTTAPATTTTAPTTTTTAPTTTTTTTTTLPPAPQVPAITPIDAFAFAVDTEVEIGRSVQDRPITVIRRGTPGGTRVLAIGVIHGNEDAGTAIIDRLAIEPVPDGVELWLVRSMNPDGEAAQTRRNANGVDLNRNFPHKWGPIAQPGDWQYAGPGPASEPETQAMVALGDSVRPDLVLWYHQDLFRINPATGRDGEVRARYAQIAGLPLVDVTGGTYTGTASQWSRTVSSDSGVGFTVELGESVDGALALAHALAVVTVAAEFF